jgi:predicted transcriptional regulator
MSIKKQIFLLIQSNPGISFQEIRARDKINLCDAFDALAELISEKRIRHTKYSYRFYI